MDGQLNPDSPPRDRGISVVELLVIMAILAVLAVGVAVVPARFGQVGANSRAVFYTQFTALQDMAIHGRAVYGMRITTRNMQAMHLRNGDWQDMGRPIRFGARAVVSGAHAAGDAPDILILPDGRYSAFELRVAAGRCRGDGWGPVTCDG